MSEDTPRSPALIKLVCSHCGTSWDRALHASLLIALCANDCPESKDHQHDWQQVST